MREVGENVLDGLKLVVGRLGVLKCAQGIQFLPRFLIAAPTATGASAVPENPHGADVSYVLQHLNTLNPAGHHGN
jgi:hypothetical protein